MEMRHGEAPLPDDEAGRAGVSEVAMARFAAFADLAEQHGLKLIVGLVTGWMSGRLFVPPGLPRNTLMRAVGKATGWAGREAVWRRGLRFTGVTRSRGVEFGD